MLLIEAIRPVLLSAPYGSADNLEVRSRLPSGYRTTGLVEVRLDDGTLGLGEGYLAVFAPAVFRDFVELIAPYLVGADAADLPARYRDMCSVTDYWSFQGAARHAIAAIELALVDAVAKARGVPAYEIFGRARSERMQLYGSGGDWGTPDEVAAEMELLHERGITIYKIRARRHEVGKAAWVAAAAQAAGVEVAIDMGQNLADPPQTVIDALAFLDELRRRDVGELAFLEEPLGVADLASYPRLRADASCPIAGGETVTTAVELRERLERGTYDIVQPDATIVGGMQQLLAVFGAAEERGAETVVHCWGSGVCLMANYHAAFAGGGKLAEWPLPHYPLREQLMVERLEIVDGYLSRPEVAGLGVSLTPEVEKRFPFRADAVYHCRATRQHLVDESIWAR